MTTATRRRLVLDDPTQARALIKQAILQPESTLYLDRVLSEGDLWLEASWQVPASGDLFRGDERARILPGTTTTEHVVQASELLIWSLRGETTPEEGVPVLTRIRNARYRAMVSPGDLLTTRVELIDQLGAVYKVRARVLSGEQRILDLTLDFAATTALSEVAG